MATLTEVRLKAREIVRRTGNPIAIYNFNPQSTISFVLRDYDPKHANKSRYFVCHIEPDYLATEPSSKYVASAFSYDRD